MNKKGFTLIELLAVIVILAIIALIAVPIVLNIISDSKESAQLRSAEMYLKGVETSVVTSALNNKNILDGIYEITKEGYICLGTITNNTCSEEETLKVEMNGETPTSGMVKIESGKVIDIAFTYTNGKTIVKDTNGKIVYGEKVENYQILTPTEKYASIRYNSNGVATNGTYNISQKYLISEGARLKIYGSGSANVSAGVYGFPLVIFFDENDNVVGYEVGTTATSSTYIYNYLCTAPENTAYAIINNINYNNSTKVYASTETISSVDVLANKTILFNGDSIIQAVNGNDGWWGLLSDNHTSANIYNYAVSGSGFVVKSNTSILERIAKMYNDHPDADLIILQGFANDAWGSVPLGTLSNNYTGDFDTTTFIGALEESFRQVKENWKDKKFLYIITYKIPQLEGWNESAFVDSIKNTCEKWNIPYVDYYSESSIPLDNEENRNKYTNDDVHYNYNGYLETYSKLENAIENLFKN